MSWLEALILGVVQGLTEFLPVSSSGHIEIGQALLGTAGEGNLTFAVIVHAATVFSTLVVLWSEVSKLFRGTFTTIKWNAEKDYVAKILVSMIPVFVVGVFFKDEVEALFGEGLLLVGVCLVVTSLLLSVSEWLQNKRQGQGHEVGYKDAIIIGIAQACAVLPGLSRSGSTIATGLLCGVKKESVAQFSFLMVLPLIFGATAKMFIDAQSSGVLIMEQVSGSALLAGFIAAFFSGLIACKWMISLVKKAKLTWFAVYCLLVGLTVIGYSLFFKS